MSLGLFCLGFCELLESLGLYVSPNLGGSVQYIFKFFFSCTAPIFLSFWRFRGVNFRSFWWCSTDLLGSVCCFNLFFPLCCWDWIISVDCLRYADSFLCHLHSAIECISELLILLTIYLLLSSKISAWPIPWLLFLCWAFLASSLFQEYLPLPSWGL